MKRFQITFKGQVYELDVEEISTVASTTANNIAVPVLTPVTVVPPVIAPPGKTTMAPAGAKTVLAPMPGKIMAVNVKVGDSVKRGDVICILEAMKMQNEIMANQDGKIATIPVSVGQTMSTGDVMVTFN